MIHLFVKLKIQRMLTRWYFGTGVGRDFGCSLLLL
jgi:hypothetical protein